MERVFRKPRSYHDPVHGNIELPEYCWKVIDTPQFQRLADLKQLGCSYYVFPGATHTRKDHSIGVAYLGGRMLLRLRELQPELNITDREIKLVRLAGLCHDLGHGPFSHSFEFWAKRARPKGGWHHEKMSVMMFNYLVTDNAIDLSESDINFVQHLITGDPIGDRKFLFEIIANSRNSVDVDKFDYIARDARNLNFPDLKLNLYRLLDYPRVIDDQICYYQADSYLVTQLFRQRYDLHKTVYSHHVAKAVELMISDILSLADAQLHISDCLDEAQNFMRLDDTILKQVEFSTSPDLERARNLLKRIKTRNLYKMVDEYIVPPKSTFPKEVPEAEIVAAQDLSQKVRLSAGDIIVREGYLNYAMKDKNPLINVKFWNKHNYTESFALDNVYISLLHPCVYEERYVRIFVRDRSKVLAAQNAWRSWLEKKGEVPSPQRAVGPVQRRNGLSPCKLAYPSNSS